MALAELLSVSFFRADGVAGPPALFYAPFSPPPGRSEQKRQVPSPILLFFRLHRKNFLCKFLKLC